MSEKILKFRKMEPKDYRTFFLLYEKEDIDYYPYSATSATQEELEKEFTYLFRGGMFFIIETLSNNPVGYWYSEVINRKNRNMELSMGLLEQYEKMEYFIESYSIIFEYCFNTLYMHKTYCYVYDFETLKANVLEKLGAKRVGILPEDLFLQGKYHDKFIYNIFAEDFFGMKRATND